MSLAQTAKVCNSIPAANNNTTTSAGSAFTLESTSDGNQDKTGKPHGFSKTLAQLKNEDDEELGWNAAIILRYLCNRLQNHGKDINGKRWVRINLDHITRQYPYMGRSTVDENVLRLKRFGCCEIENLHQEFKRPKYDRTRCYHVPRKWVNASEEELRYFIPDVAARVGVPAAVIYYNFSHWIGELQEEEETQWELRPAMLTELQPFSKPTIKRAIKTLVDYGFIQMVHGFQCLYAPGSLRARGSNPDKGGSKADKGGSNPDKGGSKADNDMYCSSYSSLEVSSKVNPAGFALEDASLVLNTINEPVIQTLFTTYGDEQGMDEMGHDADTDTADSTMASPVIEHDESSNSSEGHQASQDTTSPLPRDITDAVEHVTGVWPSVEDYNHLQRINRSNADRVKAMEKRAGMSDLIRGKVYELCMGVLPLLDEQTTNYLYYKATPDEMVRTLMPLHQKYFSRTTLKEDNTFFEILYYGSLEAIIGGIMWDANPSIGYSHPITILNPTAYRINLKFWKWSEKINQTAIEEEFAALRLLHKSPDEDKEHNASLTPAEKTRVFRNALSSRNRVGWIDFLGQKQEDIININKSGLNLIHTLFDHNPEASTADMLRIMDGCMKVYMSRPAPKAKYVAEQQWCSRKGATNVLLFAKYLKAIVEELSMSGSPIHKFLGAIHQEQEEYEMAA